MYVFSCLFYRILHQVADRQFVIIQIHVYLKVHSSVNKYLTVISTFAKLWTYFIEIVYTFIFMSVFTSIIEI